MLFISLLIAAVAVYFIQRKMFALSAEKRINYDISFSSAEVFENTEFFMYETICNDSAAALPDVKVTTTLDDGMKICYYDRNTASAKNTVVDRKRSSLVSVFSLKPRLKIERRRRVFGSRRGIYSIDNVMMTVRDITGLYKYTFKYTLPVTADNTVAVLPKPIELDKFFANTVWQSGSIPVVFSLITDPLDIAGIREYTENDPYSKINWKATAKHSRFMVNNEERTEKNRFNIILNMQSRETETPGSSPEALNYIELGITVCASLFDLLGGENAPVRFFSNAPAIDDYAGDEGIRTSKNKDFNASREFFGRGDTLSALRMLAELKSHITCEFADLLDTAADMNARGCSAFAIVSSYINDDMVNFALRMRSRGFKTTFFLTSLVKSVDEIPGDIEVFYRTYSMLNEQEEKENER